MKRIYIKTVVLLLITLVWYQSQGQSTYNSAYSRFGLGDLYHLSNAVNGAMGGIKYGVSSNFLVNPANPASYSGFSRNYFVFDAGLNGSAVRMTSGDRVRDDGHFNLSSLAFGIPLTKRWNAALGLMPYSSVGYAISDPGYNEDFGGYNTIFEGNGGISRVFTGTSFNITPSWSAGLNVNYLFGSLNYLQTITFDSISFLNLRSQKSRMINDFTMDAGVQYQLKINTEKDISLITGLSVGLPASLNARENILTQTFKYSGSGFVVIRDTVENIKGAQGEIFIPANIGIGITLKRSDRWLIGAEAAISDWSKYKAFEQQQDSLSPSITAAIGGQYKLNKIHLRGGMRFHQTYLQIRGEQLNEFGISFGVGIPFYNKFYSISMLSLGFELGQRGTLNEGLLREQFGRVWLNFTMNQERWFKRREYL